MATDLQKMMAGKMQMEAAIQTEIRQTARDIYVALVVPYLKEKLAFSGPDKIKELADLAMKAAPYLHQAAGMVQIDDAKQWEEVEEVEEGT